MTAAAAIKKYPCLKEICRELPAIGAKHVYVYEEGNVVQISSPIFDYSVRYISWGSNGKTHNVIYAGTSDVPQDVLSRNVEGEKALKPGSFFCYADKANGMIFIHLFQGAHKQIENT